MMYKQRLLPLFLVAALCTTQAQAEKDAWFSKIFYIVGTVTALVWCWAGWEFKKAIHASKNQTEEMRDVHRAARQYGEKAEEDRKIMMRYHHDMMRVRILRMICKEPISTNNLKAADVSPEFLILHDEIQGKLKQRPTL